ncbi:hypothetical protein, partial [Salmonella sp. SAL4357]|uniref:hypothetical protein n=1 Tax=Salmonella sp. SAL4357 TaxID=3159878 RepID=UPI00397B05CC
KAVADGQKGAPPAAQPDAAAQPGLAAFAPADSTVVAGLDVAAWRRDAKPQWEAIRDALPLPPQFEPILNDAEAVLLALTPPQG